MRHRNDKVRKATHELALQVAEEIVKEYGLRGLSLRKVALALGYSVGSLYLIFENLDDLILQVNANTLDDLYTILADIAPKVKQPEARLYALSHAYLQFANEQLHRWRMVSEYSLPVNVQPPNWYQEKFLRFVSLMEKSLQEFIPKLTPSICAQAARILWLGMHNICFFTLTEKLDMGGIDVAQNLIDEFMKTYLAGLKTQYPN
jgi:AcrR family transcriptional regulator